MTRLLRVFAVFSVWSVVVGCSTPPAGNGRSSRDPVPAEIATARPAAKPSTNVARIMSNALPPYESVAGLSGKITISGASTTTNLVSRAAAEFRRMYPDVTLQVTAGLTTIGPPALLEGRANIMPMSRPLTPEEVRDFTTKYGHPPTEIKVAADALAIYVEKGNPLAGLTLQQLDGIFSRTQRRGGSSIETWGQLGLTGDWSGRSITLYGYGPEDGVHQIFRQQVLEGGEFRLSMWVEPAGSSITQSVAADPGAIGCASVFFASKRVRAVPLAGPDGHLYAPTEETVRGRHYPLSRFLYICVNKPPQQPLDPAVAEFLRFLLSREGQQIVGDGNIPLDPATVEQGRRALVE